MSLSQEMRMECVICKQNYSDHKANCPVWKVEELCARRLEALWDKP